MDVRERCHCVGYWLWFQGSCRGRLAVGVNLLLEETSRSIDHLDPFLVAFVARPSTMDVTITLAAIPANPALRNLQFSPDGQVLLAPLFALYILVHKTQRSGRIVNRTNIPPQT